MRKTKILTIPGTRSEERGARDNGKSFLLTEFPSTQSEKWAIRAVSAIANSGIDVPPEVMQLGWGALAAIGFRGVLTMGFHDAEPLLDEMMECVQFVPDRNKPDVVRRVDSEDIEEIQTRLLLRSEVFELHSGFSIADFLSNLGKSAADQTPDTSDIPTSQP